jgi:hypothetical protein
MFRGRKGLLYNNLCIVIQMSCKEVSWAFLGNCIYLLPQNRPWHSKKLTCNTAMCNGSILHDLFVSSI